MLKTTESKRFHCRELLPVWQQLASEFVDNLHLTIAKVDCTVEQFICKKYRITQFPTLIWFQNGVEKDRYTDSRDINRLRDYVQIMLNSQLPTSTEETTTLSPSEDDEDEKETIIMKDVKDESTENVEDNEDKVHILNAQTFTQGVSFEGYAFVNYFAPWCSHCIKLAPVWSQLAKKFSKHPEIRISKVDCTANELLCRDHGIRAFPTLLFYRFGELIVEYNSFKDLDSLYDFVVKQVESNNDEHFLNEDNDDIGN
ncbi:unnamed protein product [Didymodactylos carnosus]|uniref:Thioredoxin domain-containing protein n=1 Tax=Didymodactylos carnosus TaxID=1234261 RepID=A0A8S2E6E5_9BILA|nr:unnamed protein product [Didymodactylos carnosus]CAF3832608.1 unnamed protein product [Didymodactylos carnosus]